MRKLLAVLVAVSLATPAYPLSPTKSQFLEKRRAVAACVIAKFFGRRCVR